MGFYAPAQLVRDAKEHGVEVRAIDVNYSEWDCLLEYGVEGQTPHSARREHTPGYSLDFGTVQSRDRAVLRDRTVLQSQSNPACIHAGLNGVVAQSKQT